MVDSVIRGNPITVDARYSLDGALTDPSLPLITIRDSLGVAQVTNATPTRVGTGTYEYTYDVSLAAVLGNWTAEWTGILGGSGVGPIIDVFSVLPVGADAPAVNPSYTYDLTTDVGKVRLLIQDQDMSSVDAATPLEQRSAAFADDELQYFVDDAGNVVQAAAQALRAWANSKQLIVIARRTGKTEVDYGSIRADLLKSANELDDYAEKAPADGFAEQSWTDFGFRQILTNEMLRETT